MASMWENATLTNKGIALQGKTLAGKAVNITAVRTGSGSVALYDLKEQTAVSGIRQTASITGIETDKESNATIINTLLKNDNLTTSYNLWQIGFYAMDPDEGEILYAIAQCTEAKKIPSAQESPGFSLVWRFYFNISNEQGIDPVIDPAGFITVEQFENKMEEAYSTFITSKKVSGESAVIKDSANTQLAGLSVYGKSTQRTTTGAQLFDASRLPTTSMGGAKITNNGDGSFSVSGSGTMNEMFFVNYSCTHEETIRLLKSGKLKLSGVGLTYPYLYIRLVVDNETVAYMYSNDSKTHELDVLQEWLDNSTSYLRFTFNGAIGKEIVSGTIKPMLYQDGNGTWEEFSGGKASPSPEYPQEIKSRGKIRNYIVPLAVNKTVNGLTFKTNADGSVTVNGTCTGLYIEKIGTATLDANEKYILSGCPATGSSDTYRLDARETAENGGAAFPDINDYGSGVEFSITPSRTIDICIRIASGAVINNLKFYPMVRPASVGDKEYRQYNGLKPEIACNIFTKNLLASRETAITSGGITYTPNADGTLTLTGTTGTEHSTLVLEYKTPVVGDYVLSGSTANTRLVARVIYKDGTTRYFTSYQGSEVDVPITEDVKEYNVYIEVKAGLTLSSEVMKPMLRMKGFNGDFDAYNKQKFAVTMPDYLHGIPVTDASIANYTDENGQMWVCDEIDFARGVYVQRVGRVNKDNLKLRSYNVTSSGCPYVDVNVSGLKKDSYCLSNMYRWVLAGITGTSGVIKTYLNAFTLYDERFTDLAQARELLKAEGFEVIYILPEPIETPLTAEQIAAYYAIHTNNPNTTVLNNAEAHMEVTYITKEFEAAANAFFNRSYNSLKKTDVVDNLLSDATDLPASARVVKELNTKMVKSEVKTLTALDSGLCEIGTYENLINVIGETTDCLVLPTHSNKYARILIRNTDNTFSLIGKGTSITLKIIYF